MIIRVNDKHYINTALIQDVYVVSESKVEIYFAQADGQVLLECDAALNFMKWLDYEAVDYRSEKDAQA